MPSQISPEMVITKLSELSRPEKQRFVYVFLEQFSLEIRVIARYAESDPELRLRRLEGATELSVRCFDQMRDLAAAEPQGRPDDAFVRLLGEIAETYALRDAIGGGLAKAMAHPYRMGVPEWN